MADFIFSFSKNNKNTEITKNLNFLRTKRPGGIFKENAQKGRPKRRFSGGLKFFSKNVCT